MLNIALKPHNDQTSIMHISKEEGISVTYLEQLLNKLRHRGLIKSIRGPKGGYVLSKDPAYITVADIVKTLEGNIYPVHCVASLKGSKNICKRRKGCVPKIVWLKLANAINDCLESITLEDLCVEARKIVEVNLAARRSS